MASDHESAREWLVQGDAVTTGSLFDHIAQEPEVKHVQRIAPDMVVLSMPSTAVARLRTVFGQRLVIEPNNDLTPPM
jgi:hypothetical protein